MSQLFDQMEERLQDAAWPMFDLLERLTALPEAVLNSNPQLKYLHDEACHLIATVRGSKKEAEV